MRSDPVEVKVGQVWRCVRPGGVVVTLHVLERGFRYCDNGQAVPVIRIHCTETGRRSFIQVSRFRRMRLVSEVP